MENKEKVSSYQKAYRQDYKKHNKRVNATFSNKEYVLLERIAVLEDKKVSTLVYDITLDYLLNKPSLPKKVHDDLRAVQILIRNIANNVNQVAHHSNIIEGLIDEHDLLEHIKKLEDTVTAYTKGSLV